MTKISGQVTYQSKNYKPEAVTGRYVRCDGKAGAYRFIVCETETGRRGPGMGATIREYVTNGAGIPADVRDRCIASKSTERWD